MLFKTFWFPLFSLPGCRDPNRIPGLKKFENGTPEAQKKTNMVDKITSFVFFRFVFFIDPLNQTKGDGD